ncbi:MAG TPA: hypothetical protein VGP07_17525 [Polyangia bacterium]
MRMSTNRSLFVATCLSLGAIVFVSSGIGCGSSGGNAKGSGGSNGSGGKSNGSGGGNGSGGNSSGSGGSNSSGSGGSNSSGSGGNSSGSGGSSSGSGGSSSGSGGSGPSDAGSMTATFSYTFDKDLQSFKLNDYADTNHKNLAAADSGSSPAVAWESADGSPDNGALKISATFTDYQQYVDPVINLASAIDVSGGKTVHARVKLVSGTFAGGAVLTVSTTSSYVEAASKWTTLTQGQWIPIDLDLSMVTASGYDASMVVQMGIRFDTGDAPEAGAFAGPDDVVFLVDTITDGDGSKVVPMLTYNFDTTVQGFALNNYADSSRNNLAAPDAGSSPTLTFDSSIGQPNPGSLKVAVTYTDYKQYVDVILNLTPTIDLTGKTVHAKITLDSGTFTGGAVLHVGTTTAYTDGSAVWTTPTMGTWTDLSLDLSTVTTTAYDPSMVIQVGIRLDTGDAPDSGSFAGPADVVFHIDSITAE